MGGSLKKIKRAFSANRDNTETFHNVNEHRQSTQSEESIPTQVSRYFFHTHRPPTPPEVVSEEDSSTTASDEDDRLVAIAPLPDPLLVQSNASPVASESTPQHDLQEEMLQQLSCPICLDLYTDPIILPCLHSMCWGCADNIWKMMNPFLCPECKREIGREKLKRNFPLNNLVSIYKRDMEARAKNNEAIPSVKDITLSSGTFKGTFVQPKACVICTQYPRVFCFKCSMAFCDTCLVNFHPTVEDTPEHPLMPVQQKGPVESETRSRRLMQTGLHNVNGKLRRVNAQLIGSFSRSGVVPDEEVQRMVHHVQ